MNVLLLHKFNFNTGWGGSASFLLGLYRELGELGHRVEVVTARTPEPFGITTCALPFRFDITFGPEKRAGEIALDEISSPVLADMASAAALKVEKELLQRCKPDLIVANHINLMARVAWHLHAKLQVPYRIISYGTDTQLLLRDRRYVELFGEAARAANQIFAISAFVGREIHQTIPGAAVEVLGGAVDRKLFYLPANGTSPPKRKRILYVGRLVTEKGICTLIEAFRTQTTAAELVLAGEGPLLPKLRQYVSTNGLSHKVKFLGYVPSSSLRSVLLESSLLVMPSTWQEPLGLVLLEAMACGVPVVASAVGGAPEVVADGVNGYLVPPGDADALAGAIDRVLGDAASYREMRENVRRTRIPSYRDLADMVIAKTEGCGTKTIAASAHGSGF